MKKEEKEEQLEKLSNSTMGMALAEHFQEKIDKLIDARTYKTNDFETEGRTSLKAVEVLSQILKDLNIMGHGKKKKKTDYE